MGDPRVTRPIEELRDSGLLWLINRVVLHPRGHAIALVYEGDEVVGWQLLGDGTEPWSFADDENELFAKVETLLNSHRGTA